MVLARSISGELGAIVCSDVGTIFKQNMDELEGSGRQPGQAAQSEVAKTAILPSLQHTNRYA
ncbi:MAG: hypothetical protein EA370_15435 [Wenzhouxiangella sp.]|nr:MAG: hypothetical protein EA370_15435 [Wenzhouxiangella sp.]